MQSKKDLKEEVKRKKKLRIKIYLIKLSKY